jgi:hypothetical protein
VALTKGLTWLIDGGVMSARNTLAVLFTVGVSTQLFASDINIIKFIFHGKHRTLAMEMMLLRGELKCVMAERSVAFTAIKASLLDPTHIQEDLNNAQSGITAAMVQL